MTGPTRHPQCCLWACLARDCDAVGELVIREQALDECRRLGDRCRILDAQHKNPVEAFDAHCGFDRHGDGKARLHRLVVIN